MEIIQTVVDKNSEKYKILLKFVNNILININENEIDDLTKFINIDRDDIIKEVNINTLKSMEKELFKHYNKDKCGYYRKSKAFVLNCLRGMLKELNLSFTYTQKEKNEYINDRSFRRTHLLYSIK